MLHDLENGIENGIKNGIKIEKIVAWVCGSLPTDLHTYIE